MKPIAFKVRGGGNYSGTKGGTVRPNEKGGTGALWYVDKTFTIASTQDQFIATVEPIISPTITTCKGSRGGCSDEALEEIKAVHAARQQQPFITKPQPMTTQPNNTPQVPLRFLSVCSGMEAASVAWEPLGWKAVGFSEIEPFPCAILKHRFPNTPNYGSLTEYQSWPVGPGTADVLVGGCPCQSFSVAGLRRGMQDPRGNLTLTYLGLADKVKPKWIVYENVPGLLSSNGGRDFGAFLGALVELGYGFAYRVLDAQYVGRCGMHSQGQGWDAVPQRRRRVFVVACRGPRGWESAASVLLKPESLCWHPAKGRKKGQATAPDAGSGVEASGRKWPADTACTLNASFGEKQGLEDQHALGGGSLFVPAPICMSSGQANAAIAEDKAHTLNATHETQTVALPVVIDRAAFNQGINAQYEPHIEQTDVMDPLVARGHHAVGVPFRKSKRACSTTDNETWVEADASNTLNNFDLGDTRTTHAVVEPGQVIPTLTSKMQGQSGWAPYNETAHILPVAHTMPHIVQTDVMDSLVARGHHAVGQPICFEPRSQDGHARICGGVSPTLNTAQGGQRQPCVAITFQPGNLPREAGADPSTTATTTLKASAGDQTPDVAVAFDTYNQTISNTTQSVRSAASDVDHVGAVFTPAMAVRRLTPNECYRLQGFPDNWGRIPWKGKPADQCPDGPQYKACGNSMAVPVMRWIGEQIARVELSHNPTNQTNA